MAEGPEVNTGSSINEGDMLSPADGNPKSDPMLKQILDTVKPIPGIKDQLDGIVKDISTIKTTIQQHGTDISSLKNSVGSNQAEIKQCKSEVAALQKELQELKVEVAKATVWRKKNQELSQKVLDLESYSRRNNLLFYGIKETIGESCETLIFSFLEKEMDIKLDKGSRPIQFAHRLGLKHTAAHRPIIARFTNVADAIAIFKKRLCLKSSTPVPSGDNRPNYYILQDYPDRINQVRQHLKYVLHEVKKIDSQAFLRQDKLCFSEEAL